MWQLAIKSLLGDRTKLLTSVLGVTFAVVLANLQGGMLVGLLGKTTLLVDYGGADIWVGHRYMQDAETGCTPIPERWLSRVRAVPGVKRADAYILVMSSFAMPDGRAENVVVVGCDPASLLGNPNTMIQGDIRAIRAPDGILVDRDDLAKLGNCQVGDVRELNGRRARVAGLTCGMVSFTTRPYVFTTLERAREYGRFANGHCSYILVQAAQGVEAVPLVERIRANTRGYLDVYDRRTYSTMSMWYWLLRTGLGIGFGLATGLGLLVGLGVVAQTLYTSVTERLKEFATLKALGADDVCVGRFLLVQAVGSGMLGIVLGLLVSAVIASVGSTPRAPIVLTSWVVLLSVLLVLGVCLVAAWLPYWRLRRIDPASVLRG
jgi:putative ABC transport system permease protein